MLTRIGIGTLALADPDTFDVSNINRQCAATYRTIGQGKVDALSDHLLTINPDLNIIRYQQGVNETNADEFVAESDYVIDAIDYFNLPEAISVHRAARRRNLFVITAAALGFGTTVLAFSPQGMTIEEYFGIPKDISIQDLRGQMLSPSGYSSQFPAYVTPEKVTEWLEQKTIPTISVGQALGPGILVSQLILHLLHRKEPVFVPDSIRLQFE